ncbi:MAG: DNA gyrase inhibitor YacG [Propylenella sp.]
MTGEKRGTDPIPLRRPRKCPTCGKPSSRDSHPFCSRRCADIDLNRWLSGRYVIPGAKEDDEAEKAGGEDEKR